MRDPIVALDADGAIVYANSAAAAAVERPRDELLGTAFVSLLDPDGRPGFRALFAEAAEAPVDIELHLTEHGSPVTASLRALGHATHVVAVTLAPPRRHTQVMEDFLRNAAHQLRTPLTSIAAAIEILQTGAKDDPVQRDRFLSHIDDHAGRLIRIARGLLVLARAQSGQPAQLDLVELRPLLDELAREASPEPDVVVTVDCADDVAAVAHADLLHEALAALVENAVEHTLRGAIRLEAMPSDDAVLLSVVDSGGGIASEHRQRIFEPFYRPSSNGDHHGLGLAIAAQAVRAMGGELTYEDADGGSRFTIRLASGSNIR